MPKKHSIGAELPTFDTNNVICHHTEQSEKGLMRHVLIRQLDHGYVVEVGCKSFAIPAKDELCKHLIRYINNPAEMEIDYWKGKIFKSETK